jgi:hypothetical protein
LAIQAGKELANLFARNPTPLGVEKMAQNCAVFYVKGQE